MFTTQSQFTAVTWQGERSMQEKLKNLQFSILFHTDFSASQSVDCTLGINVGLSDERVTPSSDV